MKNTSHVFGPVPSRRLGRSLGVDLVPMKTCSYDCVYCQLGRTPETTVDRAEYAPVGEVIAEVSRKLSAGVAADYVTLSGSGEPTLHARLGGVIERLKGITDIPVAVLTNGSLLWNDDVLRELRSADVVLPSLDAGDAALFAHVNRPHPAITFDRMLDGLTRLRDAFPGKIWLEVMLLGGITGVEAEARKLAALAERIRPDVVHLNTAVRPAAEEFAFALTDDELRRLRPLFGPTAELAARHDPAREDPGFSGCATDITELLRRRPCTVGDIAGALGIHRNEVVKYLEGLTRSGAVVARQRGRDRYYHAPAPGPEPTETGTGGTP